MIFDENYNDIDFEDEDDDAPVCVCPEYSGATHPAFCQSCNDWTDNIELALEEEAGTWADAPAIPTPARIETPVYQFTAAEFTTEKELAA